jgi:hypothetical protein
MRNTRKAYGIVVDNYLKPWEVDNFRLGLLKQAVRSKQHITPNGGLYCFRTFEFYCQCFHYVISIYPATTFRVKRNATNCTAVNANYSIPQWNLEPCLCSIPRARLAFTQHAVLQQVNIYCLSIATAQCPTGSCLSHTPWLTAPCVVAYFKLSGNIELFKPYALATAVFPL